ncbi:hypothetical protein PFHG_04296 [Plasmodium falciparum HB3]|uniref:Uncharacterized protein n=1 Tax=Plasmodium falciparum (isolate HB3) TaxID=137071 RepID=A0A0L7KGW1_PLAFX|nr:hypothetical protein PFHG_04296 [Plasmodium falciparum HB3]
MNDGIYFIHRRNLSELKDVEYSGLRKGCICEDDIKYNGVTTEEKCNNINYNDLSK